MTDTSAPARRVRHEVRDGLVVMLFSVGASIAPARTTLLIVRRAGRGR